MSAQSEWLADIALAADDLGYSIRTIEPGAIVLFGANDVVIEITSVYLSGALLRSLLAPRGSEA